MATAGGTSVNGRSMAQDSPAAVDDKLAGDIAAAAEEMARGAGDILLGHFGRSITVEYKDEAERDPVTSVDKASQEFLASEIAKRFPSHGILGEEGADEAEAETRAPDFIWALDPLDGTTNFLNGLPLYASSIGVMHRGVPIAGALFIPWPNSRGGFVLHCQRGHGCFADGEPVSVYQAEEPANNRLAGAARLLCPQRQVQLAAAGQDGRHAGDGQHRLRTGDDGPGGTPIFDHRGLPHVGHAGGSAGGDGGPGNGYDHAGEGKAVASAGVADAGLGRKTANHEGPQKLAGTAGGWGRAGGAVDRREHTAQVQAAGAAGAVGVGVAGAEATPITSSIRGSGCLLGLAMVIASEQTPILKQNLSSVSVVSFRQGSRHNWLEPYQSAS